MKKVHDKRAMVGVIQPHYVFLVIGVYKRHIAHRIPESSLLQKYTNSENMSLVLTLYTPFS